MADLFAQNCRLNNILSSWKSSVQNLVVEAHDLEEGRKHSERETRDLRAHVESLNNEFERLHTKIRPPSTVAASPLTGVVGVTGVDSSTFRRTAEPPRINKNGGDETVEDELSLIRSQLDDTERKLKTMNSNNSGRDFVAPPIPSMAIFGESPLDHPTTTTPQASANVFTTGYYGNSSSSSRNVSHCGAIGGGLQQPQQQQQQQSVYRANFELNSFNESRGVWSQPTRQVHEHHGDAAATWRTPPNQHQRNCLMHESPPPPPRSPPPAVRVALTDISIKEVNSDGKFIKLVNNSAYKDDEIGCCVLQQTYEGHSIVIFRFPPRTQFPALSTVTVWAGCGRPASADDGPNMRFHFRELMRWGTGPGYTTLFTRPNGQAIAWSGGTQCLNLLGHKDQACDCHCECGVPPVSIIKNSMSSKLNANKSASIELKQKERFQPRVLTANGINGKPQNGTIYPSSCLRFAELMQQ